MSYQKKWVAIAILTCPFFVSQSHAANLADSLKNICSIVKADDKGQLRKKMKKIQADYRVKLADYYHGITCNGNSLIRVAIMANAVNAGTLLVKKMPKKHLSAPEKDGKTLQAWVSEKGFDSSPVAAVLSKRI